MKGASVAVATCPHPNPYSPFCACFTWSTVTPTQLGPLNPQPALSAHARPPRLRLRAKDLRLRLKRLRLQLNLLRQSLGRLRLRPYLSRLRPQRLRRRSNFLIAVTSSLLRSSLARKLRSDAFPPLPSAGSCIFFAGGAFVPTTLYQAPPRAGGVTLTQLLFTLPPPSKPHSGAAPTLERSTLASLHAPNHPGNSSTHPKSLIQALVCFLAPISARLLITPSPPAPPRPTLTHTHPYPPTRLYVQRPRSISPTSRF
jgi:hypothetical protein